MHHSIPRSLPSSTAPLPLFCLILHSLIRPIGSIKEYDLQTKMGSESGIVFNFVSNDIKQVFPYF